MVLLHSSTVTISSSSSNSNKHSVLSKQKYYSLEDERMLKEWLKVIDVNGDGVISKQELFDALRTVGKSWPGFSAWWALRHADLNKNKVIDGDKEMAKLVEYIRKNFGTFKVIN